MPLLTTPTGIRLCYEGFGDPDNPVLLLIQGLGAQMLGWHDELCRQLAEAGFHVVRFDNRDVGLSQTFPEGGYNLTDMAADAAGLLSALDIDRAHVVGQSMGGMIAQQLVIDHPGRVNSLGLIYTTPSPEFIIRQELLDEQKALPRARNRAEAAELHPRSQEPCLSPGYPADVEWLREVGGLMYDRDYDPDATERQMNAIAASPDRTAALAQTTAPTTILHGDSDRLISPTAAEVLHQTIPASTLTILPGMGHEIPRPLWPRIIAIITDNAR